MPHYTCDRCQAVFGSADHPRYLVQLEVHRGPALLDEVEGGSDVDPLSQLHQLLTGIESRPVSVGDHDAVDEPATEREEAAQRLSGLPSVGSSSAGSSAGDAPGGRFPDAGLPSYRAQYDLCPRCYRTFVRDPWGHDRQVPAAVNEE